MKLATQFTRISIFAIFVSSAILACKKDNNPTTPAKDVNLKKGLLVYLPFDGNIADSSGNNNPTTANANSVLGYDEHGYANMAFNGTANGEKVTVTNNGSIKWDTAFTVSSQVMLRSYGINDFITYVDKNTGMSVSWGMGTGIPGNSHFVWSTANTADICDQWSNDKQNYDTTTFIPQIESWYNIIASYHKGTMKLYVNGKLMSTRTGIGTSVTICPSAQLQVGGWWDGDPGASLDGRLDEFRLYNRTLTDDEIAELSKDFQDQ